MTRIIASMSFGCTYCIYTNGNSFFPFFFFNDAKSTSLASQDKRKTMGTHLENIYIYIGKKNKGQKILNVGTTKKA